MDVRNIKFHMLEAFYKELPLADATVRKLHYMLAGGFRQALRKELIMVNPCDLVRLSSKIEQVRPVGSMSAEDFASVMVEVKDEWLNVFLRLALVTGARRGEIAALCWDDVDWSAGTVFVHRAIMEPRDGSAMIIKGTKTGSRRMVPVDDETLALLDGWHGEQAPNLSPLQARRHTRLLMGLRPNQHRLLHRHSRHR